MKPLRQTVARIARLNKSKEATKKSLNMSQHQLQLMTDTSVPKSLKLLIKNVLQLQGSRKFQYLITENSFKSQTISHRKIASALRNPRNCEASKFTNSTNVDGIVAEQEVHSPDLNTFTLQRINMKKSGVGNVIDSARTFLSKAKGVISLFSVKGKAVLEGKTYNLISVDQPKGVLSNGQNYRWPSFVFRDGFGKSSNIDRMRPIMRTLDSQGLFHSNARQVLRSAENRFFSTTTAYLAKPDSKDCKKKGGSLPCLKSIGIVKKDKGKGVGDNKICEKFCMPCCAPARDPPECIVAQRKRECKKFKAPRPSYSECKKDPMKNIKPCECLIQRLPPCGLGEGKSSGKTC